MRVLLLLTVLLAAAGSAAALECYACKMSKIISSVKLSSDISNRLAAFPTCAVMEKEGVSDKFKQTCTASDKSCANIIDPNDAMNRVRTCFPSAKDECKGTVCYCTTDLCNAAGGVWASAAAVAAGVGLLLIGR